MTMHKEAFALMWYGCECGHRERIWNSRDGVTPFGCGCPSCGRSTMRHIDWSRDQIAEDHSPHKGQRVWRDGTPDEAAEIMTRRIASLQGTPYEADQKEAGRLIESARNGDGDFQRGWPHLAITTEQGLVP